MTNENETVTISFSGEEFRELEAKAEEAGVPVEEYLTRMLDEEQKRDELKKAERNTKGPLMQQQTSAYADFIRLKM